MVQNIAYILGGIILGLSSMIFLFKGKNFIDIEKKQKDAEEQVAKNKEEADKLLKETHQQVDSFKKNSIADIRRKEERITKIKEALRYKEDTLLKKDEKNHNLKIRLASEKDELRLLEQKNSNADKEVLEKLASKTGQLVEELKKDIMDQNRRELEFQNAEKIAMIEEKTKEDATKIAKKHLVGIIQRLSSPTSVETRAVNVKVPRDDIKGKIIGKGGKNIMAFEEQLPDVAIVFNDLPQTISISCFNLVQRRIAQKAMEKLVRTKGGVDVNIIKKIIELSGKEVDEELYEIGKSYVDRLGFKGFNKELIRIIGRLKYRTSYGQNIMKHSMEVAWVATMLGNELGLDVNVCKVGGFLHDLGKAVDQDPDEKDAHDKISKELMEKFGFSWEEVHAAWTHHDSIPQETPEALIVKAADAVSAGRPGARQESIFSYTERIQQLEEMAKSFKGIKKVFTMSAGREVRMIVNPEEIEDKQIKPLAEEVAGRIEDEVAYPGKIKVNVIRRVKYSNITKVK